MKYAPKRDDGLMAYVVTKTSMWDHARGSVGTQRIYWAANLAEAKRDYGWSRESFVTIKVRRATPDDVTTLPGGQR